MYIICIKDLISISGAKFHPIASTVKFILTQVIVTIISFKR